MCGLDTNLVLDLSLDPPLNMEDTYLAYSIIS